LNEGLEALLAGSQPFLQAFPVLVESLEVLDAQSQFVEVFKELFPGG
jgi:hypothetical protein